MFPNALSINGYWVLYTFFPSSYVNTCFIILVVKGSASVIVMINVYGLKVDFSDMFHQGFSHLANFTYDYLLIGGILMTS